MASYTYTVYPLAMTVSVRNITAGDTIRFYVRHDPEISSDPVIDDKYTAKGSTLTVELTGLDEQTDYVINVGIVVGDSTSWIGAEYFSTPSQSAASRPDDWEWWYTIKSGGKIRLSADEWNAFCECINEFRVYDSLPEYNFTTVYSGDKISAAIVNQARTAINAISTCGSVPSKVSTGDPITASFFLDLQDALNATK